jgi:hypothetical protein
VVTEVLVWALIVTSHHNSVVDIYSTELVCREDLREARKTVEARTAGAELACVVRRSMERPKR